MGPPRILGQGLTWNDLYGLYIDLIGVPSTISEFLFLLCRFDRFSSFIVVATGHYSHPTSCLCRWRVVVAFVSVATFSTITTSILRHFHPHLSFCFNCLLVAMFWNCFVFMALMLSLIYLGVVEAFMQIFMKDRPTATQVESDEMLNMELLVIKDQRNLLKLSA